MRRLRWRLSQPASASFVSAIARHSADARNMRLRLLCKALFVTGGTKVSLVKTGQSGPGAVTDPRAGRPEQDHGNRSSRHTQGSGRNVRPRHLRLPPLVSRRWCRGECLTFETLLRERFSLDT